MTVQERFDRDDLLRLLRDPLVWEDAPPILSAEEIVSIVREADAENASAKAFCDSLLSGPSATWMERFRERPEPRTPALVRQILKRVPALLERRPEDALRATSIAVAIAEALDPADHWRDYAMTVRGQACRDHASVLAHLALYRQALAYVESAECAFAQIDATSADRERLEQVKAAVLAPAGRTKTRHSDPLAAGAAELPVCAY